ncbi:MliC family protein [Bartonella sp. CB189]|uniref:MliC family protein n=1 Tax=Bartonella sp. CB189 TaxID=3112254 RepID=UPI002F964CCC
MKKTSLILGFFAALNLSPLNLTPSFAASFILEVPDSPKPKTETLAYQCDSGTEKERIEATYLDAHNVSLVDFKWKNHRTIAANITTPRGTKYVGSHYTLWKTSNEIILYDLLHDPKEQNPLLCKEESTLLF